MRGGQATASLVHISNKNATRRARSEARDPGGELNVSPKRRRPYPTFLSSSVAYKHEQYSQGKGCAGSKCCRPCSCSATKLSHTTKQTGQLLWALVRASAAQHKLNWSDILFATGITSEAVVARCMCQQLSMSFKSYKIRINR